MDDIEPSKSAEKSESMRPENTFGKTPVEEHDGDFILMENMNSVDNMTSPEQNTTSPDIT